jgi:hypothetical protein
VNRLDVRYSRSFKTPAAALAVTAVAALLIAGCSGADKPDPKDSGSRPTSGAAGASPGALKDESASVVGWTPPAPVARTEGKLEFSVHGETRPATAEIISVQASDASTILTWQISSATDIPIQGYSLTSTHGPRFFPDGVRLVDPAAKKSYGVNTMEDPLTAYCVCSSYPQHVGPDPVRMTAEYPALPAGVTSISVRIPKFAPVTVAVTR